MQTSPIDSAGTTTEEQNTFPQHVKELVTCSTHSGEIVVRLCLWCVIKITYSVRIVN